MLDTLIAAVVGGDLGERLRQAWFRRKLSRARADRRTRVRARLHRPGRPGWKYWRGAVVRRGRTLRWRPALRRWRAVDLLPARVLGTELTRSVANGDRTLVHLAGVDADHLAVSPDGTPTLLLILSEP